MKIYTVIGIYQDADITTYGSFADKAKAEAEMDRIDHTLNAKFYGWMKDDPTATEEDLGAWIWEDGHVMHLIESELNSTPASEPYYHNICTYADAYDLVYENTDAETWNSLSYEEQYNLKHLSDWEYQRYIVINNDEVISTDDLNGDVIYREPIAEFISNAITAAREED